MVVEKHNTRKKNRVTKLLKIDDGNRINNQLKNSTMTSQSLEQKMEKSPRTTRIRSKLKCIDREQYYNLK